jgi:CheY-like chemotaxis protein
MDNLIYIVDDLPECTQLAEFYLTEAGYTRIQQFSDPDSVLDAIEQGAVPTVLVCDYDMPGCNGLQLLQRVIPRHPGITGMLMTIDPFLIREDIYPYKVLDKSRSDFCISLVRAVTQAAAGCGC